MITLHISQEDNRDNRRRDDQRMFIRPRFIAALAHDSYMDWRGTHSCTIVTLNSGKSFRIQETLDEIHAMLTQHQEEHPEEYQEFGSIHSMGRFESLDLT